MDSLRTYTEVNETGCCAVPDVEAWDRQVVHFSDKPFIRKHTRNLFHVPLNMNQVMTELQQTAEQAGATMPANEAMIPSRDLSAFRSEHLYAVTGPVPGADNVVLTGDFATRVFEGPYSEAGSWHDEVRGYTSEIGRTPTDVYFFYTTCPKCAKAYGENHVVMFAEVAPDAD